MGENFPHNLLLQRLILFAKSVVGMNISCVGMIGSLVCVFFLPNHLWFGLEIEHIIIFLNTRIV